MTHSIHSPPKAKKLKNTCKSTARAVIITRLQMFPPDGEANSDRRSAAWMVESGAEQMGSKKLVSKHSNSVRKPNSDGRLYL